MILDASGHPIAVNHSLPALADVAALCFLLNAWLHGPDCGISYSRVVNDGTGAFIALRASRRGVQVRTA